MCILTPNTATYRGIKGQPGKAATNTITAIRLYVRTIVICIAGQSHRATDRLDARESFIAERDIRTKGEFSCTLSKSSAKTAVV